MFVPVFRETSLMIQPDTSTAAPPPSVGRASNVQPGIMTAHAWVISWTDNRHTTASLMLKMQQAESGKASADVMGLDTSSEEEEDMEDGDQFDMAGDDEDMEEQDDIDDSDEEDDDEVASCAFHKLAMCTCLISLHVPQWQVHWRGSTCRKISRKSQLDQRQQGAIMQASSSSCHIAGVNLFRGFMWFQVSSDC